MDTQSSRIFERFESEVKSRIYPGSKLLDIGTGNAKRLVKFHNYCINKGINDVEFIGLDIDNKQIIEARKNTNSVNNISIIHGNGISLPDQFERTFDLVTAINSVFYPSEAYKVLKSKGYYLCLGPATDDYKEIREIFDYNPKTPDGTPVLLSIEEAKSFGKKAGFVEVKVAEYVCEVTEIFANLATFFYFLEHYVIRNQKVLHSIKRNEKHLIEIQNRFLERDGIEYTKHKYILIGKKSNQVDFKNHKK